MFKKFSAGLGAAALAVGMSFVAINANADMRTDLCEQSPEATAQVDCQIVADAQNYQAGDTVTATISGNSGISGEVALWAALGEGTFEKVDTAEYNTGETGETTAELTIPADILGGPLLLTTGDAELMPDSDFGPGQRIEVFSHNAAYASHTELDDGFKLQLNYGIEGDSFTAQVNIGGTWQDLETLAQEPIDANGEGSISFKSPTVDPGRYDVRLMNETTGQAGPVVGQYGFGVDPEPGTPGDNNDGGGTPGDNNDGDNNDGDNNDSDNGSNQPGLPHTGN